MAPLRKQTLSPCIFYATQNKLRAHSKSFAKRMPQASKIISVQRTLNITFISMKNKLVRSIKIASF